jgi:hypothetical protein
MRYLPNIGKAGWPKEMIYIIIDMIMKRYDRILFG